MEPLRIDLPHAKEAFELAKNLALIAQDHDEKATLSHLHESGILWAWIPKWMGGGGLHPLSFFAFSYALSQEDAGLCNIVGAHYAALGVLSSARAYSQLRTLVAQMKTATLEHPGIVCLAITEPDAGSDFEHPEFLKRARVNTRAERNNDGYRITGQKIYVSNAPIAQWIVFSAYTNLKHPLDSGVLGIMPIRTAGVTLGKREHKLGQNACPNAMVFFDGALLESTHVCGEPSSSFSSFLITESLGPGRAGTAAMAMGILKSLEKIHAVRLEELELEMKQFIRTLQKSHLSYRNLSFLDPVFSALGPRVDSLLELEKIAIRKNGANKSTQSTFRAASQLKVNATRALRNTLEAILIEKGPDVWKNSFFVQQLCDGRLLEIIEGTTEVCEREIRTQTSSAPEPSYSVQKCAFGWINPEMEEHARAWMEKNKKEVDHSWAELIADEDQGAARSALYGLAYENMHAARTILESSLLSAEAKEVLKVAILIGACERALEYARAYAAERVQGGVLIYQHSPVLSMLKNASLLITRMKSESLDRSPSRKSLISCLGLARDTAQVLGGMSYMKEHPISHLYIDILRLTSELLHSPLLR